MAALILASVLAAILGFAAHRASVCTVRAVAEVVSSRTAHALAAIGKSVLWSFAIIAAVSLISSADPHFVGWPLTGAAVLGGFAFGIGAALNGACAFSTLARLADGEGAMLATAAAFALGVSGFAALVDLHWLVRPAPALALVDPRIEWVLGAALILLPLGICEAIRLWRTRPSGARFHSLALAPQYRLSTAAMLIGVASSTIALMFGSASYTVTIQEVVEALRPRGSFPAAGRWILLAAMITGMLLSTIQRRTFRLAWRPRRNWLRNICGGLLMGLGVALTPGGNDTLVLYGIPTLSPHALPAFLAMLIGIGLGLSAMRAFGAEMRVACRNDTSISSMRYPLDE